MIDHVFPDHMFLPLFKNLHNLTKNTNIKVGTESDIFNNYDLFIKTKPANNEKNLIIAHCFNEVIVSNSLIDRMHDLEKDLENNPNIFLILISCYDIAQSLPKKNNFLFLYFPEYHGIYWNLYKDIEPSSVHTINKKFLSLNKRADIYRQLLYYKFYSAGWLNDSIFSYLGENYLNGNLNDREYFNEIHSMIKTRNEFEVYSKSFPNNFAKIDNDYLLDKYTNKIIESNSTVDATWLVNKNWYDLTFCSVIIETDADNLFPNFSEKTFRAISMQHPMYLFSSLPTVQSLKDLGLDLGNEIHKWHTDKPDRFNCLIESLENVVNTSIDDLKLQRIKLQEQLEYLRKQYSNLHGRIEKKEKIIFEKVLAQLQEWGFSSS